MDRVVTPLTSWLRSLTSTDMPTSREASFSKSTDAVK